MYAHAVKITPEFTGMRHFREATGSNGLVVVQEIGQMYIPAFAQRPSMDTGIILPPGITVPPASYVETIESQRQQDIQYQPDDLPERIECDDLEDFKAKGIERWKRMIQQLGNVSYIKLEPTYKTSQEGDFKSFIATEEEMQALEDIRTEILPRLSPNRPGTGNYA